MTKAVIIGSGCRADSGSFLALWSADWQFQTGGPYRQDNWTMRKEGFGWTSAR
jgi:hypothetical protein